MDFKYVIDTLEESRKHLRDAIKKHSKIRKRLIMDNQKWEWSDELALEFAAKFDSLGERIGDSKLAAFKASKQQ